MKSKWNRRLFSSLAAIAMVLSLFTSLPMIVNAVDEEGTPEETPTTEVLEEESVEQEEEQPAEEVEAETPAAEEENISLADDYDVSLTAISGETSVAVDSTITLTGGNEWGGNNHTWTSSNESIATVSGSSNSATVTGVSEGTATITHTYRYWAWNGYQNATESMNITVTKAGTKIVPAQFFYLKTPTSDPNSNNTSQWGQTLGDGSANIYGATWDSQNTFDVQGRVTAWPSGQGTENADKTFTVASKSEHWYAIYNAFKSSVEKELGVSLTEDDIESIVLIPYKISNNADGYHVDCQVKITAKNVVTASYHLWEAGDTGFSFAEAYNYKANQGQTTNVKKSYPETKVVNGVTYKFNGWYLDSGLTQKAKLPYTMTDKNVDFYAKYEAPDKSYKVLYLWSGTQDNQVHEEKTVEGKYAGDTVTETPIEIEGYTAVPVEGGSKSLTIGQDSAANTITFYYYKNVTLTANSETKTYNGTEQSVSGYTCSEQGATFAEDVTVGAKGTDAGEYPATWADTNNDGTKDVIGYVSTDQKYIVTNAVDGKLTITPAAVTMKSADLEKEYDGSALVNGDTAMATNSGWVDGEGVDITFTGSQTLVGSSDNSYTYAAKTGTKLSNYTITATNGSLTVKTRDAKYAITLEANSYEGTYDGQEHSATGIKTDKFTFDGVEYTVSGYTTEDPSSTDVAEKTNNISGTYKVTNANGDDVSSEFAVTTKNGTFKITPAAVTMKSADLEKEYDGSALVNGDTAMATNSGWVDGEGVDITFTGSQTLVGSSDNSYTYAAKTGTKLSNYTITATNGSLTVNPYTDKVTVTIKGNQATKTYDGKEHIVEDYSVEIDNTLYTANDFSYSGNKEARGVDADTYDMGLAVDQFTNISSNFTNVEFVVVEDGKLTIEPAAVKVVTESKEKVYDGTALTADGTVTGIVEGETYGFEVTGSQTEVGESENTYVLTFADGIMLTDLADEETESYTAKASNYVVTEEVGTLKVTEQSIDPNDPDNYKDVTIDDPKDSVYDGTENKFVPVVKDASGNTLVEGKDYTVTYDTDDFKDVNTIKVTITGIGNYKGEVTKSYKITKAPLVVTTESSTKEYDGTALTAPGKVTGFVEGETYTFTVTGTQTEVGESKNGYTLTFGGTAKEGNYEIVSETLGTLKVTAKKAPDTGDKTGLYLYGGMTLVAGLALVALLIARRKFSE